MARVSAVAFCVFIIKQLDKLRELGQCKDSGFRAGLKSDLHFQLSQFLRLQNIVVQVKMIGTNEALHVATTGIYKHRKW